MPRELKSPFLFSPLHTFYGGTKRRKETQMPFTHTENSPLSITTYALKFLFFPDIYRPTHALSPPSFAAAGGGGFVSIPDFPNRPTYPLCPIFCRSSTKSTPAPRL